MILIEDLGMRGYGTQGQKKRWGLYECPVCANYVEIQTSTVDRGLITECSKCSKQRVSDTIISTASKSFIEKANVVHKDRYDYTVATYKGAHYKVDIICRIHGLFSQKANSHFNGNGCPRCGKEAMAQRQSQEASSSFIAVANEVHKHKYNYDEVIYTSNNIKVKISCSVHGTFYQAPVKHKAGMGCPSCANYGFNKEIKAILYYLRVSTNNVVVYKIGVTNRTVEERFTNSDLDKISIIKVWDFDIGLDAYTREQGILREYQDFKYVGPPILNSGNTELFTIDVLGLDKEGVE